MKLTVIYTAEDFKPACKVTPEQFWGKSFKRKVKKVKKPTVIVVEETIRVITF
jgi:hypothetical protein